MGVLRGKYRKPDKEGDKPFEDGFLDVVLKLQLHTKRGMEEQTNPNSNNYVKGLFNREIFKHYKDKFDFQPENMDQRRRYLNDIVHKAEDFVINDFSDIASMKLIHSLAKNLPRERVAKIAYEVDNIKKNSYVLANKTKEISNENMSLDPIDMAYMEALRKNIYGESTNASLNQAQIDARIIQKKENYSNQEKKLFVALMLGTLWTGKEAQIASFFKKHGKPKEDHLKEEINNMILDAKKTSDSNWEIFTHGGRESTGINAIKFAIKATKLGAGELLLTSMDRDGTKMGYDIELLRAISASVSIPIIASGGVGNVEHLIEGVLEGNANAVLAASIFHFGEISIEDAKIKMAKSGINVRI